MKISLVVTNSRRKNLVFAADSSNIFSLEEAIDLVRKNELDKAHVVQRSTGAYIRTNPDVPKYEEFERLSISGKALLAYAQGETHAMSTPIIAPYLRLYFESFAEGQLFIEPADQPRVLAAVVRDKLKQQQSITLSAAKEFDIDPYLLGAILIDEITRLAPFEAILDKLKGNVVGINASVGIAQVKIDTANNLIKKELYNPNPNDKKLPFRRLNNLSRLHLYDYLVQPKHNIFFAAAYIRSLIDEWGGYIDLKDKPEIIATLYHLGYKKPHTDPKPNKRGLQILEEFYPLARKWLQ